MAYPDATYEHYTFETDNTNVDSALSDRDVLMDLAKLPSGVKSWVEARIDSSGNGLRITDSSFAVLAYDLRNFVAAPLSGQIKFKAATVASASQSAFKLFAENGPSSGENESSVYSATYVMVLPLDSAGNATQADHSGYGNAGTPQNMESGDSVTGKIGNALDFDGLGDGSATGASNEWVQVSDAASLRPSQVTVECWVNFDALGDNQVLISKNKANGSSYALAIGLINSGYLEAVSYNGAWYSAKWAISNISTGVWYHVVLVYDGSSLRLYVNGVQRDSVALGSIDYTTPGRLAISRYYIEPSGGSHYVNGKIDEVCVSAAAYSAAWLKFGYHNVNEADNELENWTLVTSGGPFPHHTRRTMRGGMITMGGGLC